MKIKELLKKLEGIDPDTTVKLVCLDSNDCGYVVSEIFAELNDDGEIELYGTGVSEE
jgi:hypothetical protein